jgi:hypothetical protein
VPARAWWYLRQSVGPMQRLLIRAVRVGLLMVLADIGLAPVMSPVILLHVRLRCSSGAT